MPKIKIPPIGADRYTLSRRVKNSIPWLFFLLLLVIIFQSIFFSLREWNPLSNGQIFLVVSTAIVFGGLALWYHRDKIAVVSEAAGKEEKETEAEFGQKFPKIDRIPGIRRLVRWMHEEGWVYSVGLILLVAIGLGLRLWNLGGPSFGDDELITAYAAKGFADTGNFVLPSGFVYDGSWLDLLFRALSIKLFGFNEFGARLPSVIFGSMTIGLAYLVGRELGGKKVGLLSAFIICFLPWEISWSREARMYAAFQLLYLGLVYTTYLALVKYRKAGWYILSFVLFIATVATDELGIVFIAVPYCWVLLNSWQKRQLKRFLAMLCAALVLCLLLLLCHEKLPLRWSMPIEPFSEMRFLSFLVDYYATLTVIGVLGMFCLFLSNNRLGMFIAVSFIIPLLILSCFLGWQQVRYIYFLIPLLAITGSFMAVHLWRLITPTFKARRYAKALSVFILVISIFALTPLHYTFQIPQREVVNNYEFNSAYDSLIHPDWKGLRREFSPPVEEATVVISTNPLATRFYLGLSTTYWLRDEHMPTLHVVYQDEEGRYREIYTGSIWIKNYAEFTSVITDSDVWVIGDHRLSYRFAPKDAVYYIETEGTLIASRGDLRIYFLDGGD